jgi:hypothetical protein
MMVYLSILYRSRYSRNNQLEAGRQEAYRLSLRGMNVRRYFQSSSLQFHAHFIVNICVRLRVEFSICEMQTIVCI